MPTQTAREKFSDHTQPKVGFRVIPMSLENKHGRPDLDKIMSRPEPAYTSGPNKPMIINDNFLYEERYAGKKGGQPRVEASNPNKKDGIDVGGDELNRKAY